jgi:hypothetical protein
VARLQQMACLDFSGPQLIEPLLHELHHLIAFDTSGYFFPGSDGALDVYIEPALARDLMDLYFEPQMRASEHKVIRRSAHDFADAVRSDHGPQVMEQLITVPIRELLRSDFYNLTLRPAQLLDRLSLVLRTPQGAGVGALKLVPQATGAALWGRRSGSACAFGTMAGSHPAARRVGCTGQRGTRQRDAVGVARGPAAVDVVSGGTPDGIGLWPAPVPPRRASIRAAGAVAATGARPPGPDPGATAIGFAQRQRHVLAACHADGRGNGRRPGRGIHITQRVPRVAHLLPALRLRSASTSWLIGWRAACPKTISPRAWASAAIP